ncbi:hypothetical protein QTP88_010010 [Uroleucon formosanum]
MDNCNQNCTNNKNKTQNANAIKSKSPQKTANNDNKRNHSSSSNSEPSSPKLLQHVSKKLFATRNRFELLKPTEAVEETIVKEKQLIDDPSTVDHLKVQTSNPEAYRTLVHYLRNEKAEFHTFQLKEDKPMRIVIRNLHPSTSTEMIKNELEHRLYEVRQVTQVIHRISKIPLPLFFVDLEPTDHSKEIFKLESILHTKIKIEEPHKPKIISQCQNCQAYGHTKAYCGYSPRCVRCGDDHSSSACPNSRQDPMRCALCTVEKRRARAKYQVTRLPSHKTAYNKLANLLKKVLAKYKSYEFEQKLHSLSVIYGSLWRETKRLLKYKTASPPLLNADNSLAVSDAEKAEVSQAHLSKTFCPHEDIHIPQHIIDVGNYLHSTFPSARPEKSFTPNEVKSMISNCSRKKSPGFDLKTANVANCLPNKAFILLTYIYNAILRLSYFPTLWKFSQIIMVAKPDKPPDLPKSYRPISLLLYFLKICERAKHSTVHQVHRAIDAISTSLENKCYCTCAFLDISQAFDKVWHEGLLFKLRKFLPTTLFLLMESYLTDRHFQIRQGSATSNIATISAGVPQGGVLSPILFNIYAADQPSTQNTIVADYADDKVILSVHNDPIIASRNLQSHLNLLSKCFIMNPPAKSSLSHSHIKNTKNNSTIHPIKIVKSNDNTNNWQTVPIKSPTTPTSPNPIIQKTNSFSSKNRFSALATNEISYEISNEVEMLSQEISNVQPKIPPIFIKDDIDFFDFCKKIKPFTDPDGFNTKSSSSDAKIMDIPELIAITHPDVQNVVISTSLLNVKRTQILQPLVPSALGITQHHTKAVPNSNCSRKDDLQSKPTGQPKPKTPPQLQSKPTPFKKILSPTLSTPMEHLSIYHNTKPPQYPLTP